MTNKLYFFLNLLFLFYSFTVLFVKLAGLEDSVNLRFLFFYGLSLLFLGIYAILWQQVIKKIPLVIAFSNKAIVIVWGMLWGVLFFNETVTIGKFLGIILVICGVILFSISKSEHKSNATPKQES